MFYFGWIRYSFLQIFILDKLEPDICIGKFNTVILFCCSSEYIAQSWSISILCYLYIFKFCGSNYFVQSKVRVRLDWPKSGMVVTVV